MTTDKFCFDLQNRLIQTSQTGGQWYHDTSPFGIPSLSLSLAGQRERDSEREIVRESKKERKKERVKREGERERCRIWLLFLFLKGMTGALAPFSNLV